MLDEIIGKLDFVELVSHKTKLTQTGGRRFKGLSPFTKERTPSFYVDGERKVWYCYSSGQGGGILDFVEKTEGLGKSEAVQFLGELVGIEVEEDASSGLRRSLRAALDFFRQYKDETAAFAKERGLPSETVDKYQLGYAPADRELLPKHLKYLGLPLHPSLINSEGLSVFYDRVMFPIHNEHGTVISFSGRSVSDNGPKYLHAYGLKKSHTVWNIHRSRSEIRKQERVVVCEGFMDAIAVERAGIPAVAVLGASPSETQLLTLGRFTSNIYILFDSDDAGRAGLLKAFDTMTELELDALMYAVVLPDKDPDQYIQHYGIEMLRKQIEDARADTELVVEAMIAEVQDGTRTKPQVIAKVINTIKTKFYKRSPTYRALDIVDRASQYLGVNISPEELKFGHKSTYPEIEVHIDAPIYERRILFACLDEPKNIEKLEKISLGDFESFEASRILKLIRKEMNSIEAFDAVREVDAELHDKALAFFTKGLAPFDYDVAVDILRVKIHERASMIRRNDIVGRPMKPAQVEAVEQDKEVIRDAIYERNNPFD